MNILELRNINFAYKSKNIGEKFFLSDISFQVSHGDFIGLLGPNGSGKSTLMKIISGILKPANGNIYFEEDEIGTINRRNIAKKIAFVPQKNNSVFPFSLFEIVAMGRTPHLAYHGFENKNDAVIVEDALNRLGIYNLRNKGINEVSGGEAQRAFIARALVQKPKLLLLDEPNAHLDIKHQIAIFDLLKELNQDEKLTIISVSHDLNLAGLYSKRGILIKEGRIIKDGSIGEIMNRNYIQEVFDVNTAIQFNEKLKSYSVTVLPNELG
ncbi:MAG: ABC transporter ATP-binding protein [Melioribacteraceae bacterium]|nr:ABC transporter ATP-binding protein [Melioribacteraceae bacterium]MCF8353947.1 ABC transporter ATP-binding protein [Melioribacteraceae bacterium]MCF8393675.1 ABC transporter ATP-binding protein [Melioribacteraceae bacterium]MCF8419583.1 ABC transporter ATP-binding protein [Melioribacteraceae bacterium]